MFLLTSSVVPDVPPPSWIVNGAAAADNGTLVVVCLGTEQYTVSVSAGGATLGADRVGHCDGEADPFTARQSPDPTSSPSPSQSPTLTPALSSPTSSPSSTGTRASGTRPTAAPNRGPDSGLDVDSSGSSSSSSGGAIAGVVLAVVIVGLIGFFAIQRRHSTRSERASQSAHPRIVVFYEKNG